MTKDILLWLVLTALFVLWCFWPTMKEAIWDYRWYRRREKDRARREAQRHHPSRGA